MHTNTAAIAAAPTACPACAQLKAVGSPFRCNPCRRNAPTAAEARTSAITRLVLEGLSFEDAKARVDAA